MCALTASLLAASPSPAWAARPATAPAPEALRAFFAGPAPSARPIQRPAAARAASGPHAAPGEGPHTSGDGGVDGGVDGGLDGGLDVGLDEVRWEVDRRGRLTTRSRWVVRVTSQQGLEAAQVVVADWRPWFEDRPKLEAYVLTPDGQRVALEPGVIAVQPAVRDGDLYTDARELHAPLPRLSVGAIADVRVVTRERRVPFRSARRVDDELGSTGPCRLRRRVVKAAPGVGLRWEVVGGQTALAAPARVEDRRGGVTLTWERRDDPGVGVFEPATGRQAWPVPVLRWSAHVRAKGRGTNGTCCAHGDWPDAAAEYAATVDARLARAKLGPLASEILGAKVLGGSTHSPRDAREAARRVMAYLRAHVRYTGLELGDAAYVPAPPAKVLERGHGDCKDLATLAVGLLRARGFPAYVALLETREGPAVTQEVPGLEAFDHAIVFVDASPPRGAPASGGLKASPTSADAAATAAETAGAAAETGGAPAETGRAAGSRGDGGPPPAAPQCGHDHGGEHGDGGQGAGARDAADAGQPLWLDPTAPSYAVGSLPPEDRGRMALVARAPVRPGGGAARQARATLVQTPAQEEDRYRERRVVALRPLGPSQARLVVEAWGAHAASIRRELHEDPAGYRRSWAREARRLFKAAAGEPATVTIGGPDGTPKSLSRDPVTVRVSLTHAGLGAMDAQRARLELPTGSVFDALPDALAGVRDEDPVEDAWQRARWLSRRLPVDLGARDVREVQWVVRWPEGAELGGGGRASDELTVGTPEAARYSLEVEPIDEREVRAAARFAVGRRPLSAQAARALAKGVAARLDGPAPGLVIEMTPARLWRSGGAAAQEEALRRWRGLAREHPEEPAYTLAFAQALGWLGQREEALALALAAGGAAAHRREPAAQALVDALRAKAESNPHDGAGVTALREEDADAGAALQLAWLARTVRAWVGPATAPDEPKRATGAPASPAHASTGRSARGDTAEPTTWAQQRCAAILYAAAAARGDWPQVDALVAELRRAEGWGPKLAARQVWVDVARGARPVEPAAVGDARAARGSPWPQRLAAALAWAARGEAVRPLRLIQGLGSPRSSATPWGPAVRLIRGRVAQNLGLWSSARAAYGAIPAPPTPRHDGPYAVAQRWLAARPDERTGP